jgi:hypothetical protein
LASTQDGDLVLFDIASPEKLIKVADKATKETPYLFAVTASGRVAISTTEGNGREDRKVIVRWLE